jgi:hypothetical protein
MLDREHVFAANRQFAVAVVDQPSAQETGVSFEVLAAQTSFDDDFPQAGNTEQQFILGRLAAWSTNLDSCVFA